MPINFMKECPRCKKKLSDEASFCFVCGALEAEEPGKEQRKEEKVVSIQQQKIKVRSKIDEDNKRSQVLLKLPDEEYIEQEKKVIIKKIQKCKTGIKKIKIAKATDIHPALLRILITKLVEENKIRKIGELYYPLEVKEKAREKRVHSIPKEPSSFKRWSKGIELVEEREGGKAKEEKQDQTRPKEKETSKRRAIGTGKAIKIILSPVGEIIKRDWEQSKIRTIGMSLLVLYLGLALYLSLFH